MTRLCAPVKEWVKSDKVDLLEIDKTVYDLKGNKGPIIADYHNFEETPDLEPILEMLKKKHPDADYYKIATKANSILDSLRMLKFQRPGVIGLCMGELGAITRICAPIFGTPIMYAPLREEDKNAPGQLLASELCEIYHFRRLNRETRIYGLIGDPVKQSLGHLFHNDFFRSRGQNAVYVKMAAKKEELGEFFRFRFAGLSVTAPLKEAVIPYLDGLDPTAAAIGAVNTICNGIGYNTDGEAALDVLGNVKGKRVVVLGAGGAARAIIYTAVQRGAKVTIVNRTVKRAEELAERFGCSWSEQVPACEILVNATSVSMPIKEIPAPCRVMDIAVNKNGLPMFFRQAVCQQAIWLSHAK